MRLTAKKVAGWHARIERANKTIANVQRDLAAHYPQVKGGDLTAVMELSGQLRSIKPGINDAEGVAERIVRQYEGRAASK